MLGCMSFVAGTCCYHLISDLSAASLAFAGGSMGATTTRLSFEEFQKLQETAGNTVHYELDEGNLLVAPSPAPRHNIVRYRLRRALTDFVQMNHLGLVLDETDFRLSENTVHKPDLAFIAQERMAAFDPDHSPIECAPSLAAEITSPTNLAPDTLKKVHQYLAAGSKAVWLVYSSLPLVGGAESSGIP